MRRITPVCDIHRDPTQRAHHRWVRDRDTLAPLHGKHCLVQMVNQWLQFVGVSDLTVLRSVAML